MENSGYEDMFENIPDKGNGEQEQDVEQDELLDADTEGETPDENEGDADGDVDAQHNDGDGEQGEAHEGSDDTTPPVELDEDTELEIDVEAPDGNMITESLKISELPKILQEHKALRAERERTLATYNALKPYEGILETIANKPILQTVVGYFVQDPDVDPLELFTLLRDHVEENYENYVKPAAEEVDPRDARIAQLERLENERSQQRVLQNNNAMLVQGFAGLEDGIPQDEQSQQLLTAEVQKTVRSVVYNTYGRDKVFKNQQDLETWLRTNELPEEVVDVVVNRVRKNNPQLFGKKQTTAKPPTKIKVGNNNPASAQRAANKEVAATVRNAVKKNPLKQIDGKTGRAIHKNQGSPRRNGVITQASKEANYAEMWGD